MATAIPYAVIVHPGSSRAFIDTIGRREEAAFSALFGIDRKIRIFLNPESLTEIFQTIFSLPKNEKNPIFNFLFDLLNTDIPLAKELLDDLEAPLEEFMTKGMVQRLSLTDNTIPFAVTLAHAAPNTLQKDLHLLAIGRTLLSRRKIQTASLIASPITSVALRALFLLLQRQETRRSSTFIV
ncbi:MAG: hypothetical protein JSR76_02445 [Verrucomicrobia bacterium]|nr:hypothetical protein [Verrucomicrobiota bacterium]